MRKKRGLHIVMAKPGTRCFAPILFVVFLSLFCRCHAQLVMEPEIYQHVVEAVHTIFNNTCVIFMYTTENPMQALEPSEANQLMSLPLFIARLHVRSFAYAVKTFKERIGDDYFTLKRPLFILINDSDEMRQQYSQVIAPWISMAYINWVIFFREETSIESFFAEIYVPIDCIFLVVRKTNETGRLSLTEVYSIAKGGELIFSEFGTWSEKDGLVITKLALYQRRSNLRGQLIRVSTVQDPPVSLIERDDTNKITGIKGFFGTVVQILQENLNCTVEYAECDSWGSLLSNGSWTGIMGMLERNETDLAAAELLMTSDRLEAIEFTTPVFSTKCRTFIKRPYFTAIKWTAYSDPFYGGIWLSLLIVIIISSFFAITVYKYSPYRNNCQIEELNASFTDILFYIFGALCSQGHIWPSIDPVRIINLVVFTTGVIILAAYSAALISFLAIKVFVMPFTTMQGLLEDRSYKFGIVRNSADHDFFQNTRDPLLRRMFEEILVEQDRLPNNYFDGLHDVCQLKDYAFMTMDNMFAIIEHQLPCILEPLDTIMQTTIAMGVPRRSPYRGIINKNILLMRDSGVLQRVIATELLTQPPKTNDHWSTVEIVDVLPLFLLVIGGSIFSIFLLLLEKIQHAKFGNSLKGTLLRKITQQKSFAK